MNSPLFAAYHLGSLTLKNRIVMAPLTRRRAGPGNVPTDLNALYYQQRVTAGLIIAEATQISPQGQGYPNTPGIHSQEQIRGWRRVTEAVHAAGGTIFLQLWHVGRVSHPALQPGRQLPVAPSAIAPAGNAYIIDEHGHLQAVPFEKPRALATEEIPLIVAQYAQAAHNAQEAGFDGVEIHAANGYLLDQFINSNSNQRTDRYGGSSANRIRFALETVEAVCQVWPSERVGIRLAPMGTFMDMGDDTPEETFSLLAERLNDYGLAYLHLVEPIIAGNTTRAGVDLGRDELLMAQLRQDYRGTLIVCGGYDRAKADQALANGRADLIAFGRSYIANPDLVARLQHDVPLNTPDQATFYGGGEQGYTDYPLWN